jgi:ParB-like chromosome segregation protein Spo0J
MIKTKMELNKIERLYGVNNIEKFESLLNEVKENGWKNVPAIVVLENDFGYFAVTGSHRYAVAEELGFEEIEVELYQQDEIEEILKRDDVDEQGRKLLRGENYGCSNNTDWLAGCFKKSK